MPDLKNQCPSHHDLLAFNSGELSFADLDRIAEHLDACTECQAAVETLDAANDQVVAALRETAGAHSWFDEAEFQRLTERAKGIGSSPAGRQERPEAAGRSMRDRFAGVKLPCQLGEYRLLQELGRGGMGVVYRAEHIHLKRPRAVKLLPQERTRDPKFVKRFYREIEAAGAVEHPHVVRATDAREADGAHFLVMEFVDGTDLSHLLRQQHTISVQDACEMVRQTAEGLSAVSQAGLVHRDIKPSNLMLDATGTVKILDLGLARLRKESGEGELTHSDQLLGSIDYMAPEQARDSKSVDIRADLYSLGCTFYHLLTGRPPFAAPQYATIESKILAHCQSPAPSLRDLAPHVPPPLVALVERLLAKDAKDRFESPAEVAAGVAEFAAGADLRRLEVNGNNLPGVDRHASTATWQHHETRSFKQTRPARSETRRQRIASAGRVLRYAVLWLVMCGTTPLLYLLYVHAGRWLPTAWSSSRHKLPEEETAWPEKGFQEVTIDETLWLPKDTCSIEILDQSSLRVFSEEYALLGIGMHDQGDLTFRVNIRQLQWTGRIGVFFGYGPGGEDAANQVEYQIVEILDGSEGKFLLTRVHRAFDPDHPRSHDSRVLAQQLVEVFHDEWNTLEVAIRHGKIVRILLNEVDFATLVNDRHARPENSSCAGRFGVYNLTSAGVFSGFHVNGQPLILHEPE